MKTSELTGHVLDRAVAKCLGSIWPEWYNFPKNGLFQFKQDMDGVVCLPSGKPFVPSIKWKHGGPIIEEKGIELRKKGLHLWIATIDLNEGDTMTECQFGPTQLIAAMRCFVASMLGHEIDIGITPSIPKELT